MAASFSRKSKVVRPEPVAKAQGVTAPRSPLYKLNADGAREATVYEAKTHLSRLLAEVEAGTPVIITRRGKRVAKIEAVSERPKRVFGSMKGLISIDDRFFEPLPDDELKAWEGG